MSWKVGLFNMRSLSEPKYFDPDLLSVRFRFAQDDNHNQKRYIMDYVGGPGCIYFASDKHPDRVYSYVVQEWLKEENRSFQTLSDEFNVIFERYFKIAQGWNKRQRDEFMPHSSVEGIKNGGPWWTIHSRRALNTLDQANLYLRVMLDPNLAYTLHLLNCEYTNYTENDWVRFSYGIYDAENEEFNYETAGDWLAYLKKATHPIKVLDAPAEWLWDIVYSIDEYGHSWLEPQEALLYRSNPFLSVEEQVVRHLEDVLFPSLIWKEGNTDSNLFIKSFRASYEPNKYDPGIRQLRIHMTSKDSEWYRMAFTFSPLLVQLFNWNSRFLTNGTMIQVDHDYRDFLISMADKAPPSYDYLKGKSVLDINALIQDRKRIEILEVGGDKRAVHIVLEPQLEKLRPRLMGFYYPSNGAVEVGLNPKVQICSNNIYSNVCLKPQLRFALEDLPPENGPRSYNLQSGRLVLKAAIVNRDHTSLPKKAPVLPAGEIITPRMVANVEVSILNDLGEKFIIDTSNGHYPVREWLLRKIVKPINGKNEEVEDPVNKAPTFANSQEFTAHIYPFKYHTVPNLHIIAHSKLRIKVDLASAQSFTVTKGKRGPAVKSDSDLYALRVNHTGSKLEFGDSAIITAEVAAGLEYTRFRNHAVYAFKQYCIVSRRLEKGSIETRTGDLFQRTRANRFFVLMRKAAAVGNAGSQITAPSMEFQTFDVLKMSLEEGGVPVDGPLLYNEIDASLKNGLYNRYLKNNENKKECMSQAEFENGNVIFCFNRPQGMAPAEGENRKIKIEFMFHQRLPCDVEVFCIAETDETFELNYRGNVVASSQLPNESYINFKANRSTTDSSTGGVMESDTFIGGEDFPVFVNTYPPRNMVEQISGLQNFNPQEADNTEVFKNNIALLDRNRRRQQQGI